MGPRSAVLGGEQRHGHGGGEERRGEEDRNTGHLLYKRKTQHHRTVGEKQKTETLRTHTKQSQLLGITVTLHVSSVFDIDSTWCCCTSKRS
eukprot:8831211-Pyramimonas_sp.AAC.1